MEASVCSGLGIGCGAKHVPFQETGAPSGGVSIWHSHFVARTRNMHGMDDREKRRNSIDEVDIIKKRNRRHTIHMRTSANVFHKKRVSDKGAPRTLEVRRILKLFE